MKADLSRHTFDAARHYSSVRYQQGRVQLDADFNEQADIVGHRVETDTLDVVGRCGAPLHDAGFALALDGSLANGDFMIGAGRYYVDGLLCENETPVPFTGQPDRRGVAPLDVSAVGSHVVYLDVWQRHVTALDDPRLRETALGGPDTATRARLTWQVRTVAAGSGAVDCATKVDAYTAATAPGTGALRARAIPAAPTAGPCIVPAAAGYQGLENQLYRVEIHDGGAPYDLAAGGGDAAITALPAPEKIVYASGTWSIGDAVEVFVAKAGSDPMVGHLAWVTAHHAPSKTLTLNAAIPALSLADLPRVRHAKATFKWSRDNGSVEALVKTVNGKDVVVVQRLEPDDVRSFAPGQWVELCDDARELEGVPGQLAQIASVSLATNTITLRAAPAFPGDVAVEDPARHLRIRRWDGAGAVKVGAALPSDGYAALEDGVQVRFEAGSYRVGAFWQIPARTATADAQSGRIEWPVASGGPAALPAAGITHRHCRIAILTSDGTKLTIRDCRPLFAPLTDPSLVYVGGDGQETLPGASLPQLLEAGVFRGTVPVAGATVRFGTSAGGRLAATVVAAAGGAATFQTATGSDGIARAGWMPDPAGPRSQQAVAELLDAAAALAPPIDFNGSLSIARQVAYDPTDKCPDLKDAHTVQDAIDVLCQRPTGGGCAVVVKPDQRLNEIIDRLIAEGHRDLCLCLTAGDHELPGGLTIKNPEISLELCGCEAGTRVKSGARIALSQFRSVTIRDIELTFAEGGSLVLDTCATVEIHSCELLRPFDGVPVCTIRRARRIRLIDDLFSAYVLKRQRPVARIARLLETSDRRVLELNAMALGEELAGNARSRTTIVTQIGRARVDIAKLPVGESRAFNALSDVLSSANPHELALTGVIMEVVDAVLATDAGTALMIGDGRAETEIAESRFVGDLVFYGVESSAAPTPEEVTTIAVLRREGRLLLRPAGGTLHLRENALMRIALGEEAFKMLVVGPQEQAVVSGVFRNAMLTANVFIRPENVLVARHAVLTANEFDVRRLDAGVVIADSAIYTANHAPDDVRLMNISSTFQEAGNLTINIVNV